MDSLCRIQHNFHVFSRSKSSFPYPYPKPPQSLCYSRSSTTNSFSHSPTFVNLFIKSPSYTAQCSKPIDIHLPKTAIFNFHSLLKSTVIIITVATTAILAAFFCRSSSILSHAVSTTVSTEEQTIDNLSDNEKERILEKRLLSNPEEGSSLQALLEVKIKKRKLPDAIKIIDRLVVLEPGERELPLLKAHLYNYDGNAEAARVEFEDIIKKDPFAVEAYHGLVMLAAQAEESGTGNGEELDGVIERIELAKESCKKEEKAEEFRDFGLLEAQIYLMDGEFEKALEVYRGLEQDDPSDFRPYLCQGIVFTLMKKTDEAEKLFEKYRTLVPKDHPYAQYLDENMATVMSFGKMKNDKRSGFLKR